MRVRVLVDEVILSHCIWETYGSVMPVLWKAFISIEADDAGKRFRICWYYSAPDIK